MKKIIHGTKKLIKHFDKLRKDLQKGANVEKFSMPDADLARTNKKKTSQTIDVSASSVAMATFTVLGILLLAYFLYSIRNLLILFFISLFFASALDPIIDWLEERKVPRYLSFFLILLLIVAVLIMVLGSLVPTIFSQVSSLITWLTKVVVDFFSNIDDNALLAYLPERYHIEIVQIIKNVRIESILKQLLENFSTIVSQFKEIATGSFKQLGSAVGAVSGITAYLFEFMFEFTLVVILTFFMVVDRNNLHDFFLSLFPKRYGMYISKKIHAIQKQIGAWFRGQVLLSLIMFTVTFIGLIIVGMGEYALTLAFVMAIGEFIPYVGPLIFLAFALPIALGKGLAVTIYFLIFHAILQFVEGNVFIPAVMNKAVGLSPIVVLLVLIIGFQFLGVVGAIIAVPLTTVLAIFVTDYTRAMSTKN